MHHWILPRTSCAARREADIVGQVCVCVRSRCLQWLTISPAQCTMKAWNPTRKAPNLPGRGYLLDALSEPHQGIHFLTAHEKGYVQVICTSRCGTPMPLAVQLKLWPSCFLAFAPPRQPWRNMQSSHHVHAHHSRNQSRRALERLLIALQDEDDGTTTKRLKLLDLQFGSPHQNCPISSEPAMGPRQE